MKCNELRQIIKNSLEPFWYSKEAEELLILTAAVESDGGEYVFQQGGGPARGFFQMEKTTHDDIWNKYLSPKLDSLIRKSTSNMPEAEHILWHHAKGPHGLIYDISYMIFMTRMHYMRFREPLPKEDDVKGLAEYWKKYYNTKLGKGTVEGAMKKYYKYTGRTPIEQM